MDKLTNEAAAAKIVAQLKLRRRVWLYATAGQGKSLLTKMVRDELIKSDLPTTFYDGDKLVRPVWDLRRFGDEDRMGSSLFRFWSEYVGDAAGFGMCCNYPPPAQIGARCVVYQIYSPDIMNRAFEARNASKSRTEFKVRTALDPLPDPESAMIYEKFSLVFDETLTTKSGRGVQD